MKTKPDECQCIMRHHGIPKKGLAWRECLAGTYPGIHSNKTTFQPAVHCNSRSNCRKDLLFNNLINNSLKNKNSLIIYSVTSLRFLILFLYAGDVFTWYHSKSKPQPSNQLPMDKIKSRPTFFLVREAASLWYTSQYGRKEYYNFPIVPTLKYAN